MLLLLWLTTFACGLVIGGVLSAWMKDAEFSRFESQTESLVDQLKILTEALERARCEAEAANRWAEEFNRLRKKAEAELKSMEEWPPFIH